MIREVNLTMPVKCIAYALATYVNSDGTNAHPGLETLMKATGASRSTVIRSLSALESGGWVLVISEGGKKGIPKGHATVYDLSAPCG